jgi:hypothetical protein
MRQLPCSFHALLLPGVAAINGCSPAAPPAVPALPAASAVERITASLNGPEVAGAYVGPPIEEFEIAAQYFPAVMRALDEPRYVKAPRHVSEVGNLAIHCRDGRMLHVQLLFAGKEPVLVTLNGVSCIRGGEYKDLGKDKYLPEVLALGEALRAIHAGDKAKAQENFDLLNRSAGRGSLTSSPTPSPPSRCRSR